jgi:hypothetical protein
VTAVQGTLDDVLLETEDPELAQARYLVQHLVANPADVLIFGESTLTYVGPHETDTRSVADLLAERLHPYSTYVVAGAGYGMPLLTKYLRLAAEAPVRPVVVHSLFLRGALAPFLRHPLYGHPQALERLSTSTAAQAWHLTEPKHVPSEAQWKQWERLAYPTIAGDRTIADFVAALRDNLLPGQPGYDEWIFEFHYGGRPEPDGLRAFTEFGRLLASSGYRSVAFQNPVNVVQATRALGAGFAEWHARNERAVLDAYRVGVGEDAAVLRTGGMWRPEEFVDPALEHLGAEARARLADVIADAVRRRIEQ